MDTLSATIESHRHYIETVGSAIVLLFISGAILAVMCGGAYATSAEGLNGVSLAFLVGALVSLAALLLVLAAVVFALFGIRSREQYYMKPPEPTVAKSTTPPLPTPSPEPAAPALATTTTNQANDDYKKALLLMESILRETRKLADGEKPDNKPFSYDNCHAAGFFSRWEDWSRILKLLEAANLGIHLKKSDWNITVNNIAEANQRLKQYYTSEGFVQVNGIWMKK